MADEISTVVIDNGSSMCKAGFTGDKTPQFVFPCVVGRPRDERRGFSICQSDFYIGDQVNACRWLLNIRSPIEGGRIIDWDGLEQIWQYIFKYQLCVDPEEHPVLMTESSPFFSHPREEMAQVLFETFQVPSFYIANPAVLSLYSSGRRTGIVLESGDGLTQIVPIYEGGSILHAIITPKIAGGDITTWIQKIVIQYRIPWSSLVGQNIIRDVKEKLAYVALDFEAEKLKATYTADCEACINLFNDSELLLNSECFLCPEPLFKPDLLMKPDYLWNDSIDVALFNSIRKCDVSIQKDMYANIVLSGGTTMFQGLPERIEKEITHLAPAMTKIKVIAPRERKYGAWIGGSILASLDSFPQMVIIREEYDEYGKGIVCRKCF
jgi:actin-related protein